MTPTLLNRVILAVVLAVAVILACILVGTLLNDIHIEVATTVGDFLKTFGAAIGILAGLWYFFSSR